MPGYFVSPLGPGQTSRTSHFTNRKKRKRAASDDDEDSQFAVSIADATEPPNLLAGASSYAALTASQATQYRTAGFPPSSTLPPPPFPHAPLKDPPTVAEAAQNDPTASSSKAPPNLRQHHLAVVTTILHRSLLNGDYARAGRAWGMLLRAEFGGKAVDVRTHGRWGIGAEILLHRYSRGASSTSSSASSFPSNTAPDSSPASSSASSSSSSSSAGMRTSASSPSSTSAREGERRGGDPGAQISPEGFQAAREYFERLILQHPYRRTQPHAVDARTFYPALFGLWIYEVVCGSQQARQRLEGAEGRKRSASSSSSASGTSSVEGESDEGGEEREGEGHRAQHDAVQAEELRRALEIAARLDGLLVSPPYDKHSELLHLRGMVALWIGDLLVTEGDAANGNADKPGFADGEMEVDEEDGMAGLLAENEARQQREMRETEIERARGFFVRARANGGKVSENVQHLLDDEEGAG